MLEFFFKSNLIFTTTVSSGARMGKIQAYQIRQFTSNMLEFLFKIGFNFLPPWAVQDHEWGQFRRTKHDYEMQTMGNFRALLEAIHMLQEKYP
jgi:hypothetical protein